MPISYSIDPARGIIRETWTGDIDAAVLSEYWRGYLADPEVLAIRRTVVDLRPSRILFTGAELSALVNGIIPLLQGRDWKTAIVVNDPLQFGVSRQYHVFAAHYSRDSIFEDPETAVDWLLS